MNRVFVQGPVPRLPTVGIIGGGQLALMLARAASRLGLRAHVLDASAACPARRDAANFCEGSYQSAATLDRFSKEVDVVTLENEFVEAPLLAGLESGGREVWLSSRTRLPIP